MYIHTNCLHIHLLFSCASCTHYSERLKPPRSLNLVSPQKYCKPNADERMYVHVYMEACMHVCVRVGLLWLLLVEFRLSLTTCLLGLHHRDAVNTKAGSCSLQTCYRHSTLAPCLEANKHMDVRHEWYMHATPEISHVCMQTNSMKEKNLCLCLCTYTCTYIHAHRHTHTCPWTQTLSECAIAHHMHHQRV